MNCRNKITKFLANFQNARFYNSHMFPQITSNFDKNASQSLRNKDKNIELWQKTKELREQIILKGKSVPKRESGPNKLSAYERMSLLKDPESEPLLLSVTAGHNLPYGNVNSAGVLTAVVKVMGKYCMVNANDWSTKGGTLYPISLKKQLRAQEIAKKNRLPCIYVVDSGGAFLPLQVIYVSLCYMYKY